MDDRHPKRRKDKYNPYTLSLVDGKCYLSFKDGQGFPHKLELDVKLYALFDRFELDDLSFLNEQERHLDQTELSEALLSRRVPENQATVEDAVYESLQTQALREGIRRLPEIQKRRLQMYFFRWTHLRRNCGTGKMQLSSGTEVRECGAEKNSGISEIGGCVLSWK